MQDHGFMNMLNSRGRDVMQRKGFDGRTQSVFEELPPVVYFELYV